MYTHKILDKCDPKNPYAPKFSGTFELPVEYAGKKRRMLAYVPHDIRESTAGILVLGERPPMTCSSTAAGARLRTPRSARNV